MKLSKFISHLDAVTSEGFRDRVKRQVAYEGLRLIAKTFNDQADPYGSAWDPLKKERKGGRGIEWDTGAMRAGWTAVPSDKGVSFQNSTPYAARQNYGWRPSDQPARPMIPSETKGLPESWSMALRRVFLRQLKRTLKVASE